MQWKLFTAGAILTGASATGLIAAAQVHSGPAALLPSATVLTTTSAPTSAPTSATSSPAGTAPPTTTTTSTQPRILPSYPPAVPGLLAQAIAGHDTAVCGLFTSTAAGQLAAATGTDSCPAAVEAFAAKVTNASSYANPSGAVAQPAGQRRVNVDACRLTWTEWGGSTKPPGPQIGRLILEQQQGSVGYLIAGYQPC